MAPTGPTPSVAPPARDPYMVLTLKVIGKRLEGKYRSGEKWQVNIEAVSVAALREASSEQLQLVGHGVERARP